MSDKKDYFMACIEDDSLTMKPYCGLCEIQLNEDYYCEKCKRQCRCCHIQCEDEKASALIDALIKGNESFQNFTKEIIKRGETSK
ncbi:MAG: hypothetical protein WC560_00700 [Syntrophales bacterium]